MAREIFISPYATGANLCFTVELNGQYYRRDTLVFENPILANVDLYRFNLTQDTGLPSYAANRPSGLSASVNYNVRIHPWDGVALTAANLLNAIFAGVIGPAADAALSAKLASDGLDLVLIESGITAGAGLVNDAGTQLTSINARQALAACLSVLAAKLAGAETLNVTTHPAGKPASPARVDATVTAVQNRTAVNLRVPT